MPITPTYPGVYIEELPSTVHTIVGVSTSITAFVGYTKRGPSDRPTTIFNYGDFERTFGGLDPDCPLTYAVNQFFANGGSEAVIVRVASGAVPATLSIANKTGGGKVEVLTLKASSSGSWANPLRVSVDYGTLNPDSLFNLTVTEYAVSNGSLVVSATESFRNLTMNSYSPTYAVDVITAGSKLVTAGRGSGIPATPGAGYSLSGDLSTVPTTADGTASRADRERRSSGRNCALWDGEHTQHHQDPDHQRTRERGCLDGGRDGVRLEPEASEQRRTTNARRCTSCLRRGTTPHPC